MERNFLLLILLASQFYGSDTFWFSYKSVTSNNALVYEQKNISPLVIPFTGSKSSTCKIKIVVKPHQSNLQLLNDNFDKILPCFYKSDILLSSNSVVATNGTDDVVEIIIEPVRFIVDFKDDFANITILKKPKN